MTVPKLKLPVFTRPICEWAERVQTIIDLAGLDPTIDATTKAISPIIFAALPGDVANHAPKKTTVKGLLEWLMGYDEPLLSVDAVLSVVFQSNDVPSIFYSGLVHRLGKAMPTGTPEDTLRVLAWGKLCDAVPPELRSGLLLADRTKPPSDDVLRKLDQASNQLSHSAVCAVQQSPSTSASSGIEQRLAAVERLLSDLRSEMQPSRPAPNPRVCYNCRKEGHFARNCPSQRTKYNCFYHDKFGQAAQRCVNERDPAKPCTFRSN